MPPHRYTQLKIFLKYPYEPYSVCTRSSELYRVLLVYSSRRLALIASRSPTLPPRAGFFNCGTAGATKSNRMFTVLEIAIISDMDARKILSLRTITA